MSAFEKKYLLIVNPAAGNGKTMKSLPKIEQILRKNNIKYEFHFTQAPMHAAKLVKELYQDFDIVVSVGGDGTINEVINGVPGFDLTFGMIPIGTGNDFARSCSIPYDSIEKSIEILLTNDVKKIDVGEVNGRKFVNVMGLGFEGRSNEVGMKLSFIKGTLKYLLAIGYNLITYKRIPMKISFDEITLEGNTYLISIGNGWNVGGGLKLTPKAKMDDGLFDICYIKNITRRRVIANFHRLINGTLGELDEVMIYRTKNILVESNQMIPLHLDGEALPGDRHRLEINLHAKAQMVIGNWSGDTRFAD
jgi:YegS/Rv2252/BmrU family lipid kinase